MNIFFLNILKKNQKTWFKNLNEILNSNILKGLFRGFLRGSSSFL